MLKVQLVGVYDRIVNLLSSIWSAITGCFTEPQLLLLQPHQLQALLLLQQHQLLQ